MKDIPKHLVLVDYESVPRVDISILDSTYRAIIFVGACQNPPQAASRKSTKHRFERVDFQKIAGSGKNALDFHIAFHLGRTFETAMDTICIVVSRDAGYDPLLLHLNSSGLRCRRVASFSELTVCRKCGTASTIEHHGGRWCTNCGAFASRPDPSVLPSNQPDFRERIAERPVARIVCGWCGQADSMLDGLYDDGEWMCGGCIAVYAR
jgi:hypothetical protein